IPPDGLRRRQRLCHGPRHRGGVYPRHRADVEDHGALRPRPAQLRDGPPPARAARRDPAPGRRHRHPGAQPAHPAPQHGAPHAAQLPAEEQGLMALHPEPQWVGELRIVLPPVLAAASAALVDRMCATSGFLPPGFARPARRFVGFLALALFFWIALYGNLANLGRETPALDLTHLPAARLFYVHFLMLGTTLVWFLAGYAGVAPKLPPPAP